jgi:uncharacterized membrane protein
VFVPPRPSPLITLQRQPTPEQGEQRSTNAAPATAPATAPADDESRDASSSATQRYVSKARHWLAERIGIVRVRQLIEEFQHRLAFVPLVMTFVAVIASQLILLIDRRISDGGNDLPALLATTIDSARAVLGAIAGGLITAFTLLVSMMLVAVQLASGQFSPRAMRNWLSDTVLRRTVGLVLATTVFCLLGLRSARDLGDDSIVPNVTVVVAVVLGVACLVAVVRAVDHVTTSLQISTVAKRISDETIAVIEAAGRRHGGASPRVTPAARRAPLERGSYERTRPEHPPIPAHAIVVEAGRCGWVQQIDATSLAEALPSESSAWIVVTHGAYVTSNSPLAWVELPSDRGNQRSDTHRDTHSDQEPDQHDDQAEEQHADAIASGVRAAFALGDSRTMQQDIGFGIAQLADIAVRALSPGINDPQTAEDITRHLAEVLLALWAHDDEPSIVEEDGRTIRSEPAEKREHLLAGFDPIRRYGRSDPKVMLTLLRTVIEMRSEVIRRELPGPIKPFEDLVDDLVTTVDDTTWLERERLELRRVAGSVRVRDRASVPPD